MFVSSSLFEIFNQMFTIWTKGISIRVIKSYIKNVLKVSSYKNGEYEFDNSL